MPRTASKEQYRQFTTEVRKEVLEKIDEKTRDNKLSRSAFVRNAVQKELDR